MKKVNLILLLLILFAAFFSGSAVTSAVTDVEHVGNTIADLEWDKYGIEITDFSKVATQIEAPALSKPSINISTDKPTYKPFEQQTITLKIKNPTLKPIKISIGVGFKVYEIGGVPFEYEIPSLYETDPFLFPLMFDYTSSFEIPVVPLLSGKYAWTAYLKDSGGEVISTDEAPFEIVVRESAGVSNEESFGKIERYINGIGVVTIKEVKTT